MNGNRPNKPKGNGLLALVIEKKAYEVSQKYVDAVIEIGVKKHAKQNAIIALQKNNVVMLRKDIYDKPEDMQKVIDSWRKDGYKVIYTTASV